MNNIIFSFSPQNWEFGFGFYKSEWYQDLSKNKQLRKLPSEIYIMFGPWSLSYSFGQIVEIVK